MESTQKGQTQTPLPQFSAQSANEALHCWGYLHTLGKVPTSLVDLRRESFAIGKGTSNDWIMTNQNAEAKLVARISKNHCTISKDCSSVENPVFIQDLSTNGTFVNGELIGFNKKVILKSCDIISFNLPMYKFFRFINKDERTYDVAEEIRKIYHIKTDLRSGTGRKGKVLLVVNRKTSKEFAMHHLRVVSDCKIMKEAEIMKNISHPNIIKGENFTINVNDIYMFLDYMQGGNLLQRIQRDKYLSVNATKHFFLQLCAAVKYLHDKSIIHRDIKPDNILLQSTDELTELKLSEFLLTKIVTKNFDCHQIIRGAQPYVSPEIQNKPSSVECTNKVDVWSLGVVLYFMFCGCLPFKGTESESTSKRIAAGKSDFEHELFRNVPESAKQLIQKMLTVDPNQRPTIDEILMHPWIKDEDPDSVLTECEIFDRKIVHIEPPSKRRRI